MGIRDRYVGLLAVIVYLFLVIEKYITALCIRKMPDVYKRQDEYRKSPITIHTGVTVRTEKISGSP